MATDTRSGLIEQAKKLAPKGAFEQLDGPGRLDGASDRKLTVALDVLVGFGDGDEVGGDVEGAGHGVRFGRYVLMTDSNGFIEAVAFDDEGAAVKAMAALDREVAT